MRWFTADLHIGHTNIIRYCGRPFRDAAEMDAALVDGWNAVVRPEDDVWILGDLAMGPIRGSLAIAGRMSGTKHLLLGNHDRPFDSGPRQSEWEERYCELAGIESIHRGEVGLELSDGTPVRMCHFPYRGDSTGKDRYLEYRPEDDSRWLLHGHIHEKWRQQGRQVNVGVNAWAGRPVSEFQLTELIAEGEADLDPLSWEASG